MIAGVGEAREFLVKEFMSSIVRTVDANSRVSRAIRIMVDNNIGSVVVTKEKSPCGIFTERDLLRLLRENRKAETIPVGEIGSPKIAKVDQDQNSLEAARRMQEEKRRLLVFEGSKLIGIVTATDIVRVIYRTGRTFDISKVISKDVAAVDLNTPVKRVIQLMDTKRIGSVITTKHDAPIGIFTERDLLNRVSYLRTSLDRQVREVATRPLVTAELGIDGNEVAGAMVARRIKRLPLTKEGKIVGIVTARDLVQAYAALPQEVEDELARHMRVMYGELCPLCNTRIDDHGLCACGVGGE